jgi:AraC-like DNA-binding protein
MERRRPSRDDRARQSGDPARQRPAAAAPTSSVVIVRAIAAVVAATGVARAGFLSRLGLAEEALADVEARLPIELVARAWQLAADATADRDFGLHLVERVPAGAFDLLEYVTRSCDTWGEALARLSRYYRLLEDAAEIRVEADGDRASLVHDLVDPAWIGPRHGVESLLATLVKQGRRAHGDFTVHEVRFRHPEPADVSEHRRFFRAPLSFGARASGFTFDRRWLDAPQPAADTGLRAVLDRQASAWLARLPTTPDLRARARRAVVQLLPGRALGIDAVARAMGTSRRTLQRGLAAEGASFQTVVDEVRSTLAVEHLAGGRTTIAEVAFLLGFSEPRAFHRAFRRWTGTTPDVYRRDRRPAAQRWS